MNQWIKLTALDGEQFKIRHELIENYGECYVSTKENNFGCKETFAQIDKMFEEIYVPDADKQEWC